MCCRTNRQTEQSKITGESHRSNIGPPDGVETGATCEAENGTVCLYSHSMVPGGFEVTSYTTRFTPFTSFTMRVEMIFRTSWGSGTQSAVMPSSEFTARMAQV